MTAEKQERFEEVIQRMVNRRAKSRLLRGTIKSPIFWIVLIWIIHDQIKLIGFYAIISVPVIYGIATALWIGVLCLQAKSERLKLLRKAKL